MKRLALYVLYEKNGKVRNYVTYYLEALKTVAERVVVIVNGELADSGRAALEACGVDILVRENCGLDFSAWKAALEREGRERLSGYDELILCNCSCYGPLYPFDEVFRAMDERDCDFWGLYRLPGREDIHPPHLQSYFLVIRKRLLESDAFWNYWQALKPAREWREAVNQETHFTPYFEKKGFSSCAFINDCASGELVEDPTVILPHKLIRENNFPLVKRKAFSMDYAYFFHYGNVTQAKELVDIIKSTPFPIEYVYEDMLAVQEVSVSRKLLHHTFILPEDDTPEVDLTGRKVALVVYSYFADLVEEDLSYMQCMPPEADIYIVVVSENLKKIWEQKRAQLPHKNVVIRMQPNRGRNEAAYWLTCKDVIQSYDFICLAHDKKCVTAKPPLIGYNFSRHCWDHVLKSPGYVRAVLALMERQPEIGLLMPPVPIYEGLGAMIVNNEWANNRKIAEEICGRLNMEVPFDNQPDAPWGTLFWLRGKAMAPFYRYDWSVEDFPEEPITVTNGTVLHALERMYPMIVQEGGYFTAWIMPASEAPTHVDNIFHFAQSLHLAQSFDFMNMGWRYHSRYVWLLFKMYSRKLPGKIVRKIRKILRRKKS